MVRSISNLNNGVKTFKPFLNNVADKKNVANSLTKTVKNLELPAKIILNKTDKQKPIYACSFDFIFCGGFYGVG